MSVVRINGCRIKRIEFRENVTTFFPRDKENCPYISRCPYQVGVRKAGFGPYLHGAKIVFGDVPLRRFV